MVCYFHLFQNFPQFIVIHTVKGFGIVNKAEIDVYLEFSCFFDDPADVGNLISGSSAFSKTSLNIWKFTVHILLKPGLENFENIMSNEISQSQKDKYCTNAFIRGVLTVIKIVETESRIVITRARRKGGMRGYCLMGIVSVSQDEKVMEMDGGNGYTTM